MADTDAAAIQSGNDWWQTLPEPYKSALEGSVIYNDYYSAILGYVELNGRNILVYSRDKCIISLAEDMAEGDSEDPQFEAMEYFDFNVVGGWVGDTTPFILSDDYCDAENTKQMRKLIPEFLGYVNRCSDKWYALFEATAEVGDVWELHLSPDQNSESVEIPVLKLKRFT